MRVMILGGGGQLGRALVASAAPGISVMPFARQDLDIADEMTVREQICFQRPDVVINAAAYTAVDQAESEPGKAETVNALAVEHIARASLEAGCRLLQLSTDFVFDGSRPIPYRPEDATRPLGVYGTTKLKGERFAVEILGDDAVVLRTAWLYASHGRNFVNTMLKLMKDRSEIGVVADQIGAPTWVASLADAVWALVRRPGVHGIHHWTDAGVASWYDFAMAVMEEATAAGRLDRPVTVFPLTTEEYPTPAKRPRFSVLNTSQTRRALGLEATHWRLNLRRMLQGGRDG